VVIDKAIEILEDILHYVKPGDPPDEHRAIELGIEALKRVKEARKKVYFTARSLLPGETKD